MKQVRQQHLRKVRAGSGDAPGTGAGDQGTPGLREGPRITPGWERGSRAHRPHPVLGSLGGQPAGIGGVLGNSALARGQSGTVGSGMGHFVPPALPWQQGCHHPGGG